MVLTFQIIYQYLRLGSRRGKLRLTCPLKPLKTINLKDKSFHNSIDGLGLLSRVSPTVAGEKFQFTVFILLENAFVKLSLPPCMI